MTLKTKEGGKKRAKRRPLRTPPLPLLPPPPALPVRLRAKNPAAMPAAPRLPDQLAGHPAINHPRLKERAESHPPLHQSLVLIFSLNAQRPTAVDRPNDQGTARLGRIARRVILKLAVELDRRLEVVAEQCHLPGRCAGLVRSFRPPERVHLRFPLAVQASRVNENNRQDWD